MDLSTAQLEAIVASALPGERLAEAQPLPAGRVGLRLASGQRADLHLFASAEQAAAAAAALRALRGEIDLPIPQVRASDAAGDLVGAPYLLAEPLEGRPLAELLPQITEEQLNDLGRQLGLLAYRVHRVACAGFGPPGGATLPDERSYAMARLERGLAAAVGADAISAEGADTIREWLGEALQPIGGGAALVCGGLTLDRLLARRSRERWVLSGVCSWGRAVGWAPAWEHITLLESARAPGCFALRVGYGNAYDAETARSYEQLREGMLRPYRVLLALEQAAEAAARGDEAERDRCVRIMEALILLR